MARAFFEGRDSAGNYGLWVTHGTAAGTHEIAVIGASPDGLKPSDLTVFNRRKVLFGGFDNGKRALWVSNGTSAGTHEIIVNGAAATGVSPGNFAVFNNDVLFSGINSENNLGLFDHLGIFAKPGLMLYTPPE